MPDYETIELVLVPYWISEPLYRGSLSLNHLFDYRKARALFSCEDLTTLISVYQSFPQFQGLCSEDALLTMWQQSAGQGTDVRLFLAGGSYNTLAHSSAAVDSTKARLEQTSEQVDDFRQTFAVISVAPKKIAVVLKPGFRFSLIDNEVLYREIVKVFYDHSTLHEVSQTSMFAAYVDALKC